MRLAFLNWAGAAPPPPFHFLWSEFFRFNDLLAARCAPPRALRDGAFVVRFTFLGPLSRSACFLSWAPPLEFDA